MRAAAPLVLCAALVAGCRATPAAPADDMAVDMAVGGDDLGGGGDDLSVGDMAMCPVGPEVCGNGCDDDRNGYTDDDDPACTTQLLVTLAMGTPSLERLILEPTPHVVALDGNPVGLGGMATYNAAFAPVAFIAYDSSTKVLERRPPGGTATTFSTAFTTRDVCVFNGELIVVDPRTLGPSKLHRFMSDGKTEILPPVDVNGIAAGCATDGKQLFVATHSSVNPSVIAVFDKSASGPVDTTVTLPIPDQLLNDQYDRIVDLAYVKKSGLFIGLFAKSGGAADSALNGQVMAPFTTDGGAGGYIDGGVWHGAGEFVP